jgi:hypothetical protein
MKSEEPKPGLSIVFFALVGLALTACDESGGGGGSEVVPAEGNYGGEVLPSVRPFDISDYTDGISGVIGNLTE